MKHHAIIFLVAVGAGFLLAGTLSNVVGFSQIYSAGTNLGGNL